jgi:hypothetical protein
LENKNICDYTWGNLKCLIARVKEKREKKKKRQMKAKEGEKGN